MSVHSTQILLFPFLIISILILFSLSFISTSQFDVNYESDKRSSLMRLSRHSSKHIVNSDIQNVVSNISSYDYMPEYMTNINLSYLNNNISNTNSNKFRYLLSNSNSLQQYFNGINCYSKIVDGNLLVKFYPRINFINISMIIIEDVLASFGNFSLSYVIDINLVSNNNNKVHKSISYNDIQHKNNINLLKTDNELISIKLLNLTNNSNTILPNQKFIIILNAMVNNYKVPIYKWIVKL